MAYFAALSKESAEYVCASIISQINAAGDNPAIFNKYTDISVCPRLSASMPFDASSSGRCPGVTNEDTNFSFKFGSYANIAVCVLALENQFGKSMGLRYMHEILDESLDLESHKMIPNRAPYGDRPSFSIHVNHRSTYTGITDTDRALTAREIAKLYGKPNLKEKFVSSFVTPGHLPLLLASKGMLAERRGHTEMSVYLLKMAGLSPAALICEMMDAQTYSALSFDKAAKYAKQNGIPFVDGTELLEHARV